LEQGTEFWNWWAALPNDAEAGAYLLAELRKRAGTHANCCTLSFRIPSLRGSWSTPSQSAAAARFSRRSTAFERCVS